MYCTKVERKPDNKRFTVATLCYFIGILPSESSFSSSWFFLNTALLFLIRFFIPFTYYTIFVSEILNLWRTKIQYTKN